MKCRVLPTSWVTLKLLPELRLPKLVLCLRNKLQKPVHEKSESRLMCLKITINILRFSQVLRLNITFIYSLNNSTLNLQTHFPANCNVCHAIWQQLFLSSFDSDKSQVKEHAKFLHGKWMPHLCFMNKKVYQIARSWYRWKYKLKVDWCFLQCMGTHISIIHHNMPKTSHIQNDTY